MADQEDMAKPSEEAEGQATVNGVDKVSPEKSHKRRTGHKSRKAAQKSSSSAETRRKLSKRANVDSSSSQAETDSEPDSDLGSDEQDPKKKPRHKMGSGTRAKATRKTKGKASSDGWSSDSSSSSADMESSDDADADAGVHDGQLDNDLVQGLAQQIRDLQLQITQLQQGYNAPQVSLLPAAQPQQIQNPPAFGSQGLAPIQVPSQRQAPGQWTAPQRQNPRGGGGGRRRMNNDPDQAPAASATEIKAKVKKQKRADPSRPDFKRVDWVWDTTNYSYKLQDSVETSTNSQYDGYVFHVRRIFDPDGKYRKTSIDIKSKLLREVLQDVMGNPKGVSLVDETPKLDPNLLFLYMDDFRAHLKSLRKLEPAGKTKKQRRKNQSRLDDKKKQLKVLIKYLDTDYDKIKSSLNPMLRNGLITFDLLWALWKPGTLAYSSTYGNLDMPRVFKVEAAERHATIHKGEFYYLDGKYFEFDGKRFGFGHVSEEIPEFKGARKITSLPCYPLSYCADEAKVRDRLVERGRKFVTLSGMHYKAYNGMAFMKRKKAIIRFNVQNSRIMIDPATFRRINPNYYVSQVRSKDPEAFGGDNDGDSDDDDSCAKFDSSDSSDDDGGLKMVTRMVKDHSGQLRMVQMPKEQAPEEKNSKQSLTALPQEQGGGEEPKVEKEAGGDEDAKDDEGDPLATIKANLTENEYLLASPVVLGFSFSEKQWLEFSVDDVADIKWNDKAWDSLVLETETKRLIKALVESRKYNPATTIDDVIQGKGKGLVAVLHGPPGTGKTLTAEGISELLKCPLYMASAGELGTDSRFLEHELQKILDICHTWGAILLLDEADVFLEKRNMQDIHRNALVSIFLRQLEYFQGILFLTTNRVETFDEAFQSRIHVALRYDKLDLKAKKAIFKMFIDRVRAYGRMEIEDFSDNDLNNLAKQDLNGREIKNVMGSAQDLAINKKEPLGISHIRQVLDVHAKFGRDLKGGTGFEDAMRSYF